MAMKMKNPNAELVDKLVQANRILYDQGVVDGFGHVSVRHDSEPEVFLLSCNRAPGLVKRHDIVCYGYDGEALSNPAERPYLERFIHGEIYRARPEVGSIVHSHSPSVIPFGVTKQPLQPVFHMAGFLGAGSAHFDIRAKAGSTDMLITNAQLGADLAEALGQSVCVLMRGHGATIVGTSLEQAVYRAIYAEVNARLQLQARSLGPITYLSEEEATLAAATTESQTVRTWNLWVSRIGPVE